jgi:hypothetical protein
MDWFMGEMFMAYALEWMDHQAMNEFMNQDHKTCGHEFPGVSRKPLVCGLVIQLTR